MNGFERRLRAVCATCIVDFVCVRSALRCSVGLRGSVCCAAPSES